MSIDDLLVARCDGLIVGAAFGDRMFFDMPQQPFRVWATSFAFPQRARCETFRTDDVMVVPVIKNVYNSYTH